MEKTLHLNMSLCRAAENPDCVSSEDWREFLSGRGYTAGVGEPLALFYKEVGAANPDAKLLPSLMV